MNKSSAKRVPWTLLSLPFLLLILCPHNPATQEFTTPFWQRAITDENSFDIFTGKKYFENLTKKTLNDSNLKIENAKFLPVIVDGAIQYCYYFDFEFDDGYAIFDDEKIYKRVSYGDYPWIYDHDIYYDLEGGFLAYDEETCSFLKVDETTGKTLGETYNADISETAYDNVDGEIKTAELQNYVSTVHPEWALAKTVLMTDYVKMSMSINSFYTNCYYYDGIWQGSWYTEGNCAPNAMTSFLYNLPTAKSPSGTRYNYCSNLLSGRTVTNRYEYFSKHLDTFSDLLSDNIYLLDENGNYKLECDSIPQDGRSTEWKLKESNNATWGKSTDLYWQVRSESIKRGFDPRFGLNMIKNTEEILETILNSYYDYDVDIYRTNISGEVASSIVFGIPVVISTRGSLVYGNHGMTIYGYKRYEFAEITNGSSITKSAYMWLVDDGWRGSIANEPRWFDPNRGSVNNYFCTKRNSLTWEGC